MRHAPVNFLGRNARGLGLKSRKWFQFWAQRLETQTLFWALRFFCFILFYLKVLMWAWFFSLSGGLKWSGANSHIGPDVGLCLKISEGLWCFGLGLMVWG